MNQNNVIERIDAYVDEDHDEYQDPQDIVVLLMDCKEEILRLRSLVPIEVF
jgi:hypothetical protein